MASFFKVFLIVLVGTAAGLGLTRRAVEGGARFDALRAGVWTGWPKIGTTAAEPYTRATLARFGETPLGAAEGLAFVARVDDAGAPLEDRCEYDVEGTLPAARAWTLTVAAPSGAPVANADERYGFTSSELLRDADGRFHIRLARTARPGNWLPLGAQGPFVLVLRLYETALTAATATLDPNEMPVVTRRACA